MVYAPFQIAPFSKTPLTQPAAVVEDAQAAGSGRLHVVLTLWVRLLIALDLTSAGRWDFTAYLHNLNCAFRLTGPELPNGHPGGNDVTLWSFFTEKHVNA